MVVSDSDESEKEEETKSKTKSSKKAKIESESDYEMDDDDEEEEATKPKVIFIKRASFFYSKLNKSFFIENNYIKEKNRVGKFFITECK